MLARFIEPVSKLDSLRVLEDAGVPPASYATLKRRPSAYAKASWRPARGNRAEVRLGVGAKVLVAVFGCCKQNWSLRGVEVRRGEQATTFTRGELAKAVAALLGHEPLHPRHWRSTAPRDRELTPRSASGVPR